MYDTHNTKKGFSLQKKTFKLYKEMCAQKDDEGCIQTAYAYHRGRKGVVEIDWKKAKEYYKKSCEYGQESACWRGKEIDVSKQIQYERKKEIGELNTRLMIKKSIEAKKWDDRVKRQMKELNDTNKTKAEKEELLKKMKLENISWKKESKKRLENEKKIIDKKKKELGL